ncbi:MAG: hypothetical protein ACRED5_20000 [Propylenella sp.]
MSGSHGDLFREIGKLVLAADAGQTIDLSAKSKELADRYRNLGMPADLMAKAIARSLGAIGVSMAIVANGGKGANGHHANGVNGFAANGGNGHAHSETREIADVAGAEDATAIEPLSSESQAKAASALFPSGLRLAVLS